MLRYSIKNLLILDSRKFFWFCKNGSLCWKLFSCYFLIVVISVNYTGICSSLFPQNFLQSCFLLPHNLQNTKDVRFWSLKCYLHLVSSFKFLLSPPCDQGAVILVASSLGLWEVFLFTDWSHRKDISVFYLKHLLLISVRDDQVVTSPTTTAMLWWTSSTTRKYTAFHLKTQFLT